MNEYFCYNCGTDLKDLSKSTFTCPRPECKEAYMQLGSMSSYNKGLSEFIHSIFLFDVSETLPGYWWEESVNVDSINHMFLVNLPRNFGIIPRFMQKYQNMENIRLEDLE